MSDNNVLPFRRHPSAHSRLPQAALELRSLLGIYDQLVALLRGTDDEGIDALTDGLVLSVVRCREALAAGLDEGQAQLLLREMREVLHQFPQTLRALLPGLGPRLSESLERKLGLPFAQM